MARYLGYVDFQGIALGVATILLVAYVVPYLYRRRMVLAEARIEERYAEDLRILEAQHLLRTTNLTINQIAEKVGYPSANTFCRAFRRNTGYNTSTYKAMLQRQNP